MASEPVLGVVFIFAGNFAPRGYAFCDGQLMSISQNTALFSILGTTYGGDGQTTFALPNLQGRAPIGQGQLNGGSNYVLGQSAGTENVTLNTNELPAHTHTMAQNVAGSQTTNLPAGALPAANGAYSTAAPVGTMPAQPTGSVGSNQGHPNLSPYLAISYIIALQGIFPSRN